MKIVAKLFMKFCADQHAAVMVEYALLAALLALGAVLTLGNLGEAIAGIFSLGSETLDTNHPS